jgi:oxalate---CoA ligase
MNLSETSVTGFGTQIGPPRTTTIRTTIGGQIRYLARLQPNHPAVVATGFPQLTYEELRHLIDDVRAALRVAGFDCRARIAIALRNGPQAALAIVAVACSAVSIPLDPRQTLAESESCLAAIQPDALIVVRGEDSAVRRAAERSGTTIIEIVQLDDRRLGFGIVEQKNISIAAELDQVDEPDPDAPAFILQTSGTAAEPKLVPYSHRNMLVTADIAKTWYNLTPRDRCLSVSPVFYAHGLKVTVFTPLLTGGSIAFPTDASKFDFSEWFGALSPTWYSAGPTLNRLVFDQTLSSADANPGHGLRFITIGLAHAPRDVTQGLQDTLGIPVLACYGASEASVISSNQPPPGRSKPGTVGLPWPDTVVIAGDDGQPLPAGKQGEILVGGATVTSGYLNAPELNRTRFVNGWFKTGDIGSIDNEGFLTVHGRKDELINRGGEKISPLEVDNALMRHPAIAEAAAFAVPHPRLGEDVAAAVVFRPGMTATAVELREFLRERLASFKVPRRIVIRGQLPKGQTGKVVRRRLAENSEEESGAEIQTAAPGLIAGAPVEGDLILKLTQIWERLLKVAPLLPNDDFFENGGDSLLAIEMLAELEQLTGRIVPNSILLDASTIGQLVQKISERDQLWRQTLIQLNTNGTQTPLFFFHGNFNGLGYWVKTIAKLLGPDQPLLIVAPHGMGDEPIPPTIEAMAADRLPLIFEAQPDGPYRLFGNCLGGLVAFEVARMLVDAGKKVELIVMSDPPTINALRSVQWLLSTMRRARPVAGLAVELAMIRTWTACVNLQKFCNVSWTRRWTAIHTKVRNLAAAVGDQGRIAPNVAERRKAERKMRYACAMSNYLPTPLAVRVVYFSIDFSGEPWRRISSDLEVIKLAGHHFDYSFADIAKHLQARLHAPAG